MGDWYQQLRLEVQQFAANKRFLLAVSGGVDSIFLTELFRDAALSFAIAHVNYRLRADADADAEFVRQRAQQLGVAYFEHVPAAPQGEGIQAWAREERYRFFDSILASEDLDYVVLAQHRNDQLEQFFLKALRPSGAFSLAGMRKEEGNRYRPLLHVSKEQLKLFLVQNNIAWREDLSNADPEKYRRNWLRNEWLPGLFQKIPSAQKHISSTQELLREAELVQKQLLRWFFKDLISELPYGILQVNIEAYRNRETGVEVLSSYLQPKGFSPAQVSEILNDRSSNETKHFLGSFDLDIEWRGRYIYIHPKELPERTDFILEDIEAVASLEDVQGISQVTSFNNDGALYLPIVSDLFPIKVRPVKTGDSIACLDGGRKRKKLKEIFKEAKVPLCLRKNIYTWESAIGILYLETLRSRNYVNTSLKAEGFYKIEII